MSTVVMRVKALNRDRARPEATDMAIYTRMPQCAALMSRMILDAIETERMVTEKVLLSVLLGQ